MTNIYYINKEKGEIYSLINSEMISYYLVVWDIEFSNKQKLSSFYYYQVNDYFSF